MKRLVQAVLVSLVFAGTWAGAIPVTSTGEVNLTSADVGGSFVINFNGIGGDPVTLIPGLTGEATFTVASMSTSQLVLNVSLENTSSPPITASRISVLAFDTNPTLVSASETSTLFNAVVVDGHMPIVGSVEFCATAGPNCSGGAGGGVTIGQTGTATLTLNFANGAIANGVQLSDFHVRYQSIVGAGTVTSGVGNFTPPVPEPASAAVFALGALLAGVAVRKRLTV